MATRPGNKILAIIPAYNEASRVAEVVTAATDHLPVVVVDDGSTDDTADQAQAAGATIIRNWPNQGKGAALRAGFRHALAGDYQAVITLDADGQHDPAEIPKFVERFAEQGGDLIIGWRRLRGMPPIRRLANWLGRQAFSWAVGRAVPDNQSGYRLISRRLMAALEDSQEPGFEFELEMIVACVSQGFGLDSVFIQTIYSGEGSHIDPGRHLFNFLRLVWRIRRGTR